MLRDEKSIKEPARDCNQNLGQTKQNVVAAPPETDSLPRREPGEAAISGSPHESHHLGNGESGPEGEEPSAPRCVSQSADPPRGQRGEGDSSEGPRWPPTPSPPSSSCCVTRDFCERRRCARSKAWRPGLVSPRNCSSVRAGKGGS